MAFVVAIMFFFIMNEWNIFVDVNIASLKETRVHLLLHQEHDVSSGPYREQLGLFKLKLIDHLYSTRVKKVKLQWWSTLSKAQFPICTCYTSALLHLFNIYSDKFLLDFRYKTCDPSPACPHTHSYSSFNLRTAGTNENCNSKKEER